MRKPKYVIYDFNKANFGEGSYAPIKRFYNLDNAIKFVNEYVLINRVNSENVSIIEFTYNCIEKRYEYNSEIKGVL